MTVVATVLIWVLWVFLALLGVVLVLLHVPYIAKASAEWDENHLEAHGWLGWPLRLLGVMVTASLNEQRLMLCILGIRVASWSFKELARKEGGAEDADDVERTKTRSRKRSAKRKRKQHPAESLYLMRMPYKGFALKRVAKWLYLRGSIQGRFGFDDPFLTSQVAALLALIQIAAPDLGRDVELDYVTPCFEGRMRLSMAVWLPRIEVGIIAFLLSRRGRAMVRYYWSRPKPAPVTT